VKIQVAGQAPPPSPRNPDYRKAIGPRRGAKSEDGSRAARRSGKTTTMPLRVELKPFERIIIGDSVIINSGARASFLIDGDTPILREKDTVTAESADTPVKRLYHCVQTMYLKNDVPRFRTSYLAALEALRDSCAGSPDAFCNMDADIANIDQHVSAGSLYKALKEIRKLMKRDEERPAA
jgi:flagellar protein FlbT